MQEEIILHKGHLGIDGAPVDCFFCGRQHGQEFMYLQNGEKVITKVWTEKLLIRTRDDGTNVFITLCNVCGLVFYSMVVKSAKEAIQESENPNEGEEFEYFHRNRLN